MRETWFAAVASGDADELRPLLTDDYEVWANGPAPLRGIDQTVAVMRDVMRRFHVHQTFDPVESVAAASGRLSAGSSRLTCVRSRAVPHNT